MVALGLFLLLIAGAVTAGMVIQNTDASTVTLLGQAVTGTLGGLFVAGVITGVAALLGITLMLAGARRRRARRIGLKRQVRDARGEKESLEEENLRLKRELESTREAQPAYPTDQSDEYAASPSAGEGRSLFHR